MAGKSSFIAWRAWTATLAVALTASCGRGEHEPSETEMRTAVEVKFEQVNAELRQTADACRARAFQGNPVLAMQCLTICGASGGQSCNLSFKVTRFKKLGCASGGDQPGYVCDYVIGFTSDSPFVRSSLNTITGSGDTGHGRFLRQENGVWQFLRTN